MNVFQGYRITSAYNWRKDPITGKQSFHTGIDLVKLQGGKNAPIEAFLDGTVIFVEEVPKGKTGTGYGNFGLVVAIRDAQGHNNMYCHLHKALVKVGDKVKAGQVIGLQGKSGRGTGEHLHFEIRTKCSPSGGFGFHIDPDKYLNENYKRNNQIIVNKPVDKGDKFMDDHLISPWAKDAVYEMKKLGLYKGDETGKISPLKPVTKEELAVIISRLMKVVQK